MSDTGEQKISNRPLSFSIKKKISKPTSRKGEQREFSKVL